MPCWLMRPAVATKCGIRYGVVSAPIEQLTATRSVWAESSSVVGIISSTPLSANAHGREPRATRDRVAAPAVLFAVTSDASAQATFAVRRCSAHQIAPHREQPGYPACAGIRSRVTPYPNPYRSEGETSRQSDGGRY